MVDALLHYLKRVLVGLAAICFVGMVGAIVFTLLTHLMDWRWTPWISGGVIVLWALSRLGEFVLARMHA